MQFLICRMKHLSFLYPTLGTVFILSALLKVASFASFVQETGVYMEAYFWSASKTGTVVLAVGVCAAEFILGVLTFVKRCAFCISLCQKCSVFGLRTQLALIGTLFLT